MTTASLHTIGFWLLLSVCLGCIHGIFAGATFDSEVDRETCDPSTPIKAENGSVSKTLPKGTTCSWVFENPKDQDVYLMIEELSLAPGDVAKFFKNQSSEVLEMSGRKSNFVVVLSAKNSTFILDSSNRSLDMSTLITFSYSITEAECKMAVNADSGEIAAPHFWIPTFASSISCTYDISSETNTTEHQVWSFKEVDLKKGDIAIKSDGKTVANLTDGATHSADLIVNGTQVTINIFMATSKNQSGFSATYASFDNAPTIISKLNETKAIWSTGYPHGYLGNQDLRWLISVPSGHFVNISIDDYDIEAGDQLVIADGDSLYASHFGTSSGENIAKGAVWYSSNSIIWIQFKTKAEQYKKGFKITLTPEQFSRSIKAGDAPVPFKIETDGNDALPEDALIIYQISVAEGRRAQVDLISMNDTLVLPFPQVSFYEGWSASGTPLAVMSSTTPFYPVVSHGNKMLMVVEGFGGSERHVLEGEVMVDTTAEEDVYEILNEKQGTLQFSSVNKTVNATWIIQNYDTNSEISLSIKELNLPEDVWLIVYETEAPEYAVAKLGRGSPQNTTFPLIRAAKMGVDLVDERNETATLEGDVQFQASYGTEDDCKRTLDPGVEKGQITTPGFPNQYPYNEVCKWKRETATSDIIRVYFDSFQVFDEHNFAIDVTSENVTKSVLSKSGDEIPDDLILTQLSDMTFSFDSSFNGQLDDLNVGQGVKANYEVLSCGGNITKENGTLKSPGFPANISASTRCVWVVTLPPPAENTSVSILKFKLFAGLQNGLSNEEDPSINSLMIRDGGSLRAPPITGNLTDGKEFLSRTNVIWVEYVFEPGTTKNKGFPFQLNYTTYACPVSQQCKNGICMHPDWKCDGYDQCGDHSDEDDCTCVVTKSGAVSYLALAMSILATAVIAVLIACFAPMIYRRVRFGGYSELRDFMTPVPT